MAWTEKYAKADAPLYEVITLDVSPATDWATDDVITGQTSAQTCTCVAKLTATTYVVKSRSGAYTLDEIIGVTGVAEKLADQGAAKPTFSASTLGSETYPWTWAQVLLHLAAGIRVNLKNDATYDLSAGAVTISTAGPWIMQGYTTTAGDLGKATLDNGTATTDMLTISGGPACLRDLILSSSATSGNGDGLRMTGYSFVVERVVAKGWYNNGLECTVPGEFIQCETYDCCKSGAVTAGFALLSSSGLCTRCISHDHNTGDTDAYGFYIVSAAAGMWVLDHCVADTVGGAGFVFTSRSQFYILHHCDAYNCGVDGFLLAVTGGYIPCTHLENCNSISNTGHGYQTNTATSLMLLEKCGSYNNAARLSDAGKILDENAVTYVAVPYDDAPNGNFTLDIVNGVAGRTTAQCGFTQTQGYSGATTPQRDLGASQNVAPAAANVRYGIETGATAGTLVVPGEASNGGVLAQEAGAAARGGSGTCAKFTPPANKTSYGYWDFYVPVTAAASTFTFYWAKSAAAFGSDEVIDAALKVSIWDTDDPFNATPGLIASEVVDITAADTDYHAAAIDFAAPAAAGLVRIRIELKDGTTAGFLYLDDFSMAVT